MVAEKADWRYRMRANKTGKRGWGCLTLRLGVVGGFARGLRMRVWNAKN